MNSIEPRAALIEWLNEIKTWSPASEQDWNDYILTDEEWIDYKWPLGRPNVWTKTPGKLHVVLFTTNNEYHITVGDTYIGGMVTARMKRAGENWNRGNDIPDGDFSKKTWDMIMRFIVRYELVAKTKVKPTQINGIATIPLKESKTE